MLRPRLLVAAVLGLLAADGVAKPKVDSQNVAARVALGKALAAGELDAVRIGWTYWPTRELSLTVQIEKGRLRRHGSLLKGDRSERPLTTDERKALLEALREAKVERLAWVDRDVKNERDRVLNLDVFQGPRAVPIGAFVRMGSTWRTGPTAKLAELLERWLAPR